MRFEYTPEGYKQAMEFLATIPNSAALIQAEQSVDGFTITALANSIAEKQG